VAGLATYNHKEPIMSKKSLATSPAAVVTLSGASTASTLAEDTVYILTNASASQAVSVAAPTFDGIQLTFLSTTTGQPIITFTGAKLRTGTAASATTATLAAQPGSGITVISSGGLWYVVGSSGTVVYA
jgi:uncharacterized metal-binding protein